MNRLLTETVAVFYSGTVQLGAQHKTAAYRTGGRLAQGSAPGVFPGFCAPVFLKRVTGSLKTKMVSYEPAVSLPLVSCLAYRHHTPQHPNRTDTVHMQSTQ
jgi:hypothetical protein